MPPVVPSPPPRLVGAFLFAAALAWLAGCQSAQVARRQTSLAPVVPPRGFFFSHFRAPLVLPPQAPLPSPGAERTHGARRLLYLKIPYANLDLSTGRAGLESAARKAGLAKVVYADYEYRSLLGYFQTITIHAWGYPAAGR